MPLDVGGHTHAAHISICLLQLRLLMLLHFWFWSKWCTYIYWCTSSFNEIINRQTDMSRAWYQTRSISCKCSCACTWIPLMLNPMTSHVPHNAPSVSEAGPTCHWMSGDLPMPLICASACCNHVCRFICTAQENQTLPMGCGGWHTKRMHSVSTHEEAYDMTSWW